MAVASQDVLPKLGKVPVAEIDQTDIRDTLAPIWQDKADTAKKALNRLPICPKHGAALGVDVDLQAAEKASARHLTQDTRWRCGFHELRARRSDDGF